MLSITGFAASPGTAVEPMWTSAPGSSGASRSRSATKRSGLAGIGIAVVGLHDLIAMKRAAGRPLDRSTVTT